MGISGRTPLFSEDFESGNESWVDVQVAANTAWKHGTLAIAAVSTAHSGTNAYSTDFDSDYADGVNSE
ncbi:MAG: hypothetical protein GWQ05_20090 [Verrucomicrobiaceae bacterium]|nr:hypothetical protein [Verrucomicrobiaceae bacterium]